MATSSLLAASTRPAFQAVCGVTPVERCILLDSPAATSRPAKFSVQPHRPAKRHQNSATTYVTCTHLSPKKKKNAAGVQGRSTRLQLQAYAYAEHTGGLQHSTPTRSDLLWRRKKKKNASSMVSDSQGPFVLLDLQKLTSVVLRVLICQNRKQTKEMLKACTA